MESTSKITHGEIEITVTTSKAQILTRREAIWAVRFTEALAMEKGDPERYKLWAGYIGLIAAVVEVKGIPWPLSFEEFLKLPEELVNKWIYTVQCSLGKALH
ncbi:MAG: hypothetical protein JXA14_24640 [Anaerolineae bacterium]|nr:hypothetical protein [Anaerolineae bacterium]